MASSICVASLTNLAGVGLLLPMTIVASACKRIETTLTSQLKEITLRHTVLVKSNMISVRYKCDRSAIKNLIEVR